jgi:transcriptional regulator with XRE-family HTH domain
MTTKLPKRHQGDIADEIKSQLHSFGARLRELRRQRGWTLEELACRSRLSRAFLSRLESGGRQASIAAVLTLARIFGVSVASLFESHLAAEPCVIVRAGDAIEKSVKGLKYVSLSHAGRFYNLQPIRVKVSPTRRGQEHYHHEGEEWIYLLSGSLSLSLAGKIYDLEAGDAAHFDSRLPHRLIARGTCDAEVLLVASPVSSPQPNGMMMQPLATQNRAIPVASRMSFSMPSRPPETRQTTLKISDSNG